MRIQKSHIHDLTSMKTSIKISPFGEVLPRLCIESLGRSIATSRSSAKSCELSCELSSGLRQVREDPKGNFGESVPPKAQRASYFRGKTINPEIYGGWVPQNLKQTQILVIQFGRSLHQPSFRVVRKHPSFEKNGMVESPPRNVDDSAVKINPQKKMQI